MKQPSSADHQLPDVRWDDVRMLLALMRESHLGRAAKRLHVDSSTVSRRLASLEERLGMTLFERTREGLVATAAVEQLLPAAEAMELGMAQLAKAALGFEREVEGQVRVSCPPALGSLVLAPQLGRLIQRHPQLRVDLDLTPRFVDLSRREADLALRVVRPASGDLVVRRLMTTRYIPATSPKYAAELGRLQRWSDARWVSWGRSLGHIPYAKWLADHAPEVQPVLTTDSAETQISAIKSGVGVALMPERLFPIVGLRPVRLAKSLAPPDDSWPVEELWLTCLQSTRQVPRIAAMWDFVVETLSEAGEP